MLLNLAVAPSSSVGAMAISLASAGNSTAYVTAGEALYVDAASKAGVVAVRRRAAANLQGDGDLAGNPSCGRGEYNPAYMAVKHL